MKFDEILHRITGLSCPICGISWTPSEPEINIAKRIIIFLEARRVLYIPSEMENPTYCVESVIEIRNFLTTELSKIDEKTNLYSYVSAMRKACNKFLSRCDKKNGDILIHGGNWGHWASWTFAAALGEMRGTFGTMVTQIASAYGLNVEDDLANIIPE
ncbi:DUF6650 family protein [Pectinatus frisingensis]|uniref:DUF6650 family protein n=1 Tax=Pectinatus frisingensis TaxID=865 RepID=UPI003D80546A